MDHLPVFLDVRGRAGVVVGGGSLAAAKARLLVRAGARVTAVAERFGEELEALAAAAGVTLAPGRFHSDGLSGAAIVIAASGEAVTDAAVAAAARERGIPVNVVDRPSLSTFLVPAIVDRDPLIVAVSSGGAAPVLARRVRAAIERMLPARIGRLATFAREFRDAVKRGFPDGGSRRRFWERFFESRLAERVIAGDEDSATAEMARLIATGGTAGRGIVHIVGAGPGDPELLTLKAQRLLQTADVIVYDRLVSEGVLDHARRDAERIFVGKAPGAHDKSQAQINAILCREAAAGRRVVRLKGGDPFVFGRGGEEMEALAAAGIEAEVVPGITAATGCGATAGIPLTHRDHAQGVVFITGHGCRGEPPLDWEALVRLRQTIVVYMGATNASAIAGRLIGHGMAPDTPAAVVVNGTHIDQRVARGPLRDLDGLVARAAAEGQPALLIIGDVAGLAAPTFASAAASATV